MKTKSRLMIGAFLALFATLARADEPPTLVILGAGFTGTWDTEVLLGNPSDQPLDVTVSPVRLSSDFSGCQADPCPPPFQVNVTIPERGQGVMHYSDTHGGGVAALYVSSAAGQPLPVVRARAYATATPSRAMELPITSYATLVTHGAQPLDLVGALRTADGAHSNLVLAEASNLVGGDATVRLDAIDSSGTILGSTTVAVPLGHAVFLTDELSAMGLTTFNGHILVTQTGGAGVIAAALATLTPDGGFAVSAGFNP